MKKLLFALSFIFLISHFQTSAQLVGLGVKAGYNSASISGYKKINGIDEVSTLHSWHAGAFVEFNLVLIALHADLIYSNQGIEVFRVACFLVLLLMVKMNSMEKK